LKLSELPRRTVATVASVDDQVANDAIARRLRELGFVPGERVEVMAVGPIAAEPMLVQVGFTRFALRRREAARVSVRVGVAEASEARPVPAASAQATTETQLEPADVANVAGVATHPDISAAAVTPAPLDPQARASA
jgi:ferrous iron transport protein A